MARGLEIIYIPVAFSDGELETNIGKIGVHPMMDLKEFQSIIAQATGNFPNQFSVTLISPDKYGSKRIPITNGVNFGALGLEKGCFFNVKSKRPRKEKRRKSRQDAEEKDGYVSFPTGILQKKDFPPDRVLLRRIPENRLSSVCCSHDRLIPVGRLCAESGLSLELFDYRNYEEERFRNLQLQQQAYMRAIDLYAKSNKEANSADGQESERMYYSISDNIHCEDCMNATERPLPFHLCVRDPIVIGFRTKAGPIRRPSKVSD